MLNPFDAQIAALTAEIEQIRSQIASKRSEQNAQRERQRQWLEKYNSTRPNRRDPNDLHMAADAANHVQRLESEIGALNATLTQKLEALESAKRQRDAVDRGAADRMAKGDDPTSAYQGSVEERETAELKAKIIRVVLIVLGVLAVAAAITAFIRWRKKR